MGKNNSDEPVRRKRNKQATRSAILEAVETLLVRDGYDKSGVNAVAREAGVDKVLIYRYFGGMAGLLEAYAEHAGLWPSPEELAGGDVESLKRKSPAERLTALSVNYLRALRERPGARAILARESSGYEELSDVLESRRLIMEQVVQELLIDEGVPGLDVPALWAVLEASVNGLAVRSLPDQAFHGLDLGEDKDWTRLEAALRTMVNAVFAGRA